MTFPAKLLRAAAAALFAAALSYEAIAFFQFPRDLNAGSTFLFETFILAAAAVAAFAPPGRSTRWRRLAQAAFVFALAALVPFAFSQSAFGTHDVNSILITARENRLGEMAAVGTGSFAGRILEHSLALVTAIVAAIVLLRRVRGFTPILWAVSALLIALNPVSAYLYARLVPNPAFARVLPERDIIAPVVTVRPAVRKNLIVVYMESLERTYRDIPETAAAFAPLARIEDGATSARNVDQLAETGFTAGGLVATQCGVPLYPRGMFHVRVKARGTTDAKVDFSDFLSRVTCLGDILTADGYVGSYMNGSDLEVFSKGEFFGAHGYTRLFGRSSDPRYAADPRQNMWGLNDEVLFEAAGREVETLARGGKPFVLSILTLATHGPDALLDDSCRFPSADPGGLPAAIHCTGLHVEALIRKVRDLGIADRTVIVLLSDHLAMRNSLEPAISAHMAAGGVRRNSVMLVNAGPARIIHRPATMIDVYPTLLDALGYRLRDGRANMGVSLLTDRPTLTQSMGLATLNEALDGNPVLQNYLWLHRPRRAAILPVAVSTLTDSLR